MAQAAVRLDPVGDQAVEVLEDTLATVAGEVITITSHATAAPVEAMAQVRVEAPAEVLAAGFHAGTATRGIIITEFASIITPAVVLMAATALAADRMDPAVVRAAAK